MNNQNVNSNPFTTGNNTRNMPVTAISSFSVDHMFVGQYGASFTLTVNGITVNNCKLAKTHDGKLFISFPSRKTNRGYFPLVYARFSKEDNDKIVAEVNRQLNTFQSPNVQQGYVQNYQQGYTQDGLPM